MIKKGLFPNWEGLFVTHTVEEWLFGYEDSLLKFLNSLVPQFIPSYVFALSVSPPGSLTVVIVSHSQATQSHSQATQSHSQATQSHSQATQSHSQATQSHSQATQSHSQATQSHFQATQSHSQVTQSHSHVNDSVENTTAMLCSSHFTFPPLPSPPLPSPPFSESLCN